MAEVKTQILKPGDNAGVGSMGNTYSPLIPFDCIFDTDVGLIETIRKEYRSGNMFNLALIDKLSKDRRDLIYYLYTRDEQNPLYNLMINPDMKTASSLYKEFKDKIYDKMIENGVFTGLFQMCVMFKSAPEIHASILYRNLFELNFLKGFEEELKGIHLVDLTEARDNIDRYNQIYCKYVSDAFISQIAEKIDHRTIYFLRYGFNFEIDEDEYLDIKETPATVMLQVKRNHINVIDAYDVNKLRKE